MDDKLNKSAEYSRDRGPQIRAANWAEERPLSVDRQLFRLYEAYALGREHFWANTNKTPGGPWISPFEPGSVLDETYQNGWSDEHDQADKEHSPDEFNR